MSYSCCFIVFWVFNCFNVFYNFIPLFLWLRGLRKVVYLVLFVLLIIWRFHLFICFSLFLTQLLIRNKGTLQVKSSWAKSDENFCRRKFSPTNYFYRRIFFADENFKIVLFCNNFSCRSKVLGSLRPKSDLLRIYSVWDPTYSRK